MLAKGKTSWLVDMDCGRKLTKFLDIDSYVKTDYRIPPNQDLGKGTSL